MNPPPRREKDANLASWNFLKNLFEYTIKCIREVNLTEARQEIYWLVKKGLKLNSFGGNLRDTAANTCHYSHLNADLS